MKVRGTATSPPGRRNQGSWNSHITTRETRSRCLEGPMKVQGDAMKVPGGANQGAGWPDPGTDMGPCMLGEKPSQHLDEAIHDREGVSWVPGWPLPSTGIASSTCWIVPPSTLPGGSPHLHRPIEVPSWAQHRTFITPLRWLLVAQSSIIAPPRYRYVPSQVPR